MVLKGLGKVLSFAIILLFLVTLYSTISSRITGGAPKVFGKEIMTILSGSMEPGIATGGIIAVDPITPEQQGSLQPGDVVTYKSLDDPNSLITHRIVSVEGSAGNVQYITKGDNNDAADSQPIPSGNVIAKYANFTVPFLGYFLEWVKSKAGISIVIIVPGLLMMASSMISIFRLVRKMEHVKGQKAGPAVPSHHPQ